MKNTRKKEQDQIRGEYDFSRAERGKFHRPLGGGYKVHVHQADGTVIVNHYTLAEGTVLLAPDVREYFSNFRIRQRSPAFHHRPDGKDARSEVRRGQRAGSRQVAEGKK